MLSLTPQTVYNWYRDILSDYHSDIRDKKFMNERVYLMDEETGEIRKEAVVYILKPENMGSSMMIDEKKIGKNYTTIISNNKTSKIALLLDSMNPDMIRQAILMLGDKVNEVKNICSDMSPMMKKICGDMFVNAKTTVDKFHVMFHVYDALQTIRLNIKHQIKSKDDALLLPDSFHEMGLTTEVELIERSRYILYMETKDWSEDEKKIMQYVFDKHGNLKKAHKLVENLRAWYDRKNIGKLKSRIEHNLEVWIEEAECSGLKEFKSIVKMFLKHQDDIIRFFEEGLTNAKAENLNSRIQRFLMCNYGIRDRDFFFFRVKTYFA